MVQNGNFQAYEELTHMSENAKILQRQLHETLLDKQARDEAHAAERAQWEMEITQLKMQLNKVRELNYLSYILFL